MSSCSTGSPIRTSSSQWTPRRSLEAARLVCRGCSPSQAGTAPTAVCLWEAPSIDALRDYLDPATAGMSENTYFDIDSERAVGLRSLLRQAPHSAPNITTGRSARPRPKPSKPPGSGSKRRLETHREAHDHPCPQPLRPTSTRPTSAKGALDQLKGAIRRVWPTSSPRTSPG